MLYSYKGVQVPKEPKTKRLIIENKKHGTFTVLYDADDEKLISQYKWYVYKDKRNSYAQTHIPHPDGGWYLQPGRKTRRKRTTTIQMHKLIIQDSLKEGMQVDHINHNGLDNRKSNLRPCTFQQNRFNQRPHKNSASPYKGVTRQYGKWCAQIFTNGKSTYIGSYNDEEEAARAYDAKARELFGEYAYLNFPN